MFLTGAVIWTYCPIRLPFPTPGGRLQGGEGRAPWPDPIGGKAGSSPPLGSFKVQPMKRKVNIRVTEKGSYQNATVTAPCLLGTVLAATGSMATTATLSAPLAQVPRGLHVMYELKCQPQDLLASSTAYLPV